MKEELLTAEEVAKVLKLSPFTIQEWNRRGRLPCVWLSPHVRRFRMSEVLKALESRERR